MNQCESLEANATLDYRNLELQNCLEYLNEALKTYEKFVKTQFPDNINKRLNNKIKLIQTKMNENSLKDFLDKKKVEVDESDQDDMFDMAKLNSIKSAVSIISTFGFVINKNFFIFIAKKRLILLL